MKLYLKNPARKKQYLLLAVDALLVFAVFVFAYIVRVMFYEGETFAKLEERITWLVIIAVFAHWVSFYLFELYNIRTRRSDTALFALISISVLVASGTIAVASYLFPHSKMGRVVLSIHIPVMVVLVFAWRKMFLSVLMSSFKKNNIVVIGSRCIDENVRELVAHHGKNEYQILGRITCHDEQYGNIDVDGKPLPLGISSYIDMNHVKTVIIGKAENCPHILQKELVKLKFNGVEMYDYPTFYSKLTARIPTMHVTNEWVLFTQQDRTFQPLVYVRLKQFLDILLALLGLIISLPFFLIIVIAIKLTSKGSCFFKQERLGLNEVPFTLFKFRTMVMDAERESGPRWSGTDDMRITKIGKILRKTHFDELPQLVNILRGDMSFVGPRPIRKVFEDEFAKKIPLYELRHIIKPGVTGWAQVQELDVRTEEGPLERFQYDLFYIRNQSIFLDLLIILKTIQRVLFRRGV